MGAHPVIDPAADITAKGPLTFYLGTHRAHWLWNPAAGFKLCVSYHQLAGRWNFGRATHGWMLDSGAYTELRDHGRWTAEPIRYVQDLARFDQQIGNLEWAAYAGVDLVRCRVLARGDGGMARCVYRARAGPAAYL